MTTHVQPLFQILHFTRLNKGERPMIACDPISKRGLAVSDAMEALTRPSFSVQLSAKTRFLGGARRLGKSDTKNLIG